MKVNIVKFDGPGMDVTAKELYGKLYGIDVGERFLEVLSASPDEIAVISRLIAFLKDSKKGEG